ncbi:hypothetical protein [Streptosporangium sp. 'caverna']|uniref:hypothetical protein n=1 Tax=Streptosporangium sp. 'caverna' TaxID=2202249 RepID=UPI000D7D4681|nr:hypothetical protein [Streptosporangium sp. 'caverna']AWS40959.1 hypothetical protein DKM19_05890 [Streptosporangium sp. 'caverna']
MIPRKAGARSHTGGGNEGRQVKYHAGPMKTHGKGRCVKCSGTIWDDGRDAAVATARRKPRGNRGRRALGGPMTWSANGDRAGDRQFRNNLDGYAG